MDDTHLLEKLEQADLTPTQQNQLFSLITDVFQRAIDARSPKNRPPGKAGLRAEKGYYRLLYLEGDLKKKIPPHEDARSAPRAYDWDVMPVILRQLKDIPDLQREIREGIETAIEAALRSGHLHVDPQLQHRAGNE